jgi:hypothetical protein
MGRDTASARVLSRSPEFCVRHRARASTQCRVLLRKPSIVTDFWRYLAFAVLAHLSDVMLRVQLKTKLGNEIELGFQKIDMVLFVR